MNLPGRNHGFTIVELAVVVTIIGFLIALLVKGDALVHDAKVQSAISLIGDLRTAVATFKQRYHMLPGDFPVTTEIPVRVECLQTGPYGGDGTGLIDGAFGLPGAFANVPKEAQCVPEVLSQAGLVKADQRANWAVFNSGYGMVWVKSITTSQVVAVQGPNTFAPATHVIEFENLPCSVVQDIDRKMDDGFLGSGKAIASANSCVPNGVNDPVPFYAAAL